MVRAGTVDVGSGIKLALSNTGIVHFYLTISLLGNFAYILSSADFFQSQPFRKIISRIASECQTV